MGRIRIKILKTGKIVVETIDMHGDECKKYVEPVCSALDSVPLNLPDNPQPRFHSDDNVHQAEEIIGEEERDVYLYY